MELRDGIRCVVVALLLMGTGCSLGSVQSPSTRLFTLGATVEPQEVTSTLRDEVIGIGPVSLAAYLDRPQIVTRVSPHELKAAELSQWAEPLKNNIARVIRENVSVLTGSEQVFLFPWRRSLRVDYQAAVEVLQFDAAPDGLVTLVAQWAVYGENGKELHINRRTTEESRVSGTGYDAIAKAMSRALGDLSREIVAGIQDVKSGV
ncbi:hypothetical protein D3OALGA1CA_1355 [Olavius algarvensis associated proteobacterium Delta 3]|nr:hypothetical protein D3OALGA1CA_1355 [Olavius algarvensis associated proteobacterium Delta 3]CAB5124369.1 hypothetical protein D3OALGB2SA_3182 [Olavius algarvensis associated proteobacterium Delta 3]